MKLTAEEAEQVRRTLKAVVQEIEPGMTIQPNYQFKFKFLGDKGRKLILGIALGPKDYRLGEK